MIEVSALQAAAFAGGYLLGSIPFGLILTRLFGLGDIRTIGSGNIGATNVLRTGNKAVAAATLVLDALKGTLAVLLAWAIAPELAPAAGFGAFIGHLFPVWLGFKGGKGVSTYIGVLAALSWPSALVFGVVWAGSALVTRYSSASGLLACLAAPIAVYYFGGGGVALLFLAMTAIVWWRHAANIQRLIAGTESRIGSPR
jgi:glycerol-3-phosphate acyltransferase PlsY